jgi:hypothetical protein
LEKFGDQENEGEKYLESASKMGEYHAAEYLMINKLKTYIDKLGTGGLEFRAKWTNDIHRAKTMSLEGYAGLLKVLGGTLPAYYREVFPLKEQTKQELVESYKLQFMSVLLGVTPSERILRALKSRLGPKLVKSTEISARNSVLSISNNRSVFLGIISKFCEDENLGMDCILASYNDDFLCNIFAKPMNLKNFRKLPLYKICRRFFVSKKNER